MSHNSGLPPVVIWIRQGICQMFYTIEISEHFIITPKKRVNRVISGEKLRIKELLFIYFEQIVSLFANVYSNTKSFPLLWEKSRLNLVNFTEKVIFCVNLKILPAPKNISHKCHFLMKASLSTRVWGLGNFGRK